MKNEFNWVIVFTDPNGKEVKKYRYADLQSIKEDLNTDLKWLVDLYRYEIVNAAN